MYRLLNLSEIYNIDIRHCIFLVFHIYVALMAPKPLLRVLAIGGNDSRRVKDN